MKHRSLRNFQRIAVFEITFAQPEQLGLYPVRMKNPAGESSEIIGPFSLTIPQVGATSQAVKLPIGMDIS